MDIIKTNIEIFIPTDFLLEETKHKLRTYLSNIYENPYCTGRNYNYYKIQKWEIYAFLIECCYKLLDGIKINPVKSIGGEEISTWSNHRFYE